MEKLKKALDERLEKAKYLKRTGSPGNYKYIYKEKSGKYKKEDIKKKKRPGEALRNIKAGVQYKDGSGNIKKLWITPKGNITLRNENGGLESLANIMFLRTNLGGTQEKIEELEFQIKDRVLDEGESLLSVVEDVTGLDWSHIK